MDLRWLLRLYPGAWRARYETEMRALLEQRRGTPATALDLLLGALDAHLNRSALAAGSSSEPGRARRVPSVVGTVLLAFALFIVLRAVAVPGEPNVPRDPLVEGTASAAVVSVLTTVAVLASALALVAIGAMLGASRLRSPGSRGQRMRRALLPMVPLLVTVAGFAAHALWLRGQPWWGVPPFVVFWLSLLMLSLLLGRMVVRDHLAEREVRLIFAGAAIVVGSMVMDVTGLLASKLAVSPAWAGDAWSVRWIVGLILLGLPTILGLSALQRGYAALREPRAA
jgi:hypothetical protein